jgi:hypothetical protein
MASISRGIGWSQESNLLYQILKQLTRLTSIIFGLTPKYKVYTALLTQSGGDNLQYLYSGDLTVGVTYVINSINPNQDFTNVGAPNNNIGTYFVATGTTPTSWNDSAELYYNTGAPVATVLENTIGNIWFTYIGIGVYLINSNELFTIDKTINTIDQTGNISRATDGIYYCYALTTDTSTISFQVLDSTISNIDSQLFQKLIEIRVYN